MTWINAARLSEIPDDEPLQVNLDGHLIALYQVGGNYYATQDTCTHAKASLTEGFLDGDCIECPLHEARFHIPTGKLLSGPACDPLRVFSTKIDADVLWLKMEEQESCKGLES